MNEAAVAKKLADLLNTMVAAPVRGGSRPRESDGVYVHNENGPAPDEMVDHLTLQVKYLLFDLEATRRENRYLRQMLETRPPFRDESTDEGPHIS